MAAERDVRELDQLIMQFARMATQALREKGFAGLSLTHMHVLKRLSRQDERASDLAASLGVTPAAVTKLIDQLVVRGYVARSPSRTDRRSAAVSISPVGKAALRKSARARGATVRRLLQPLDHEEATVLARALRRMMETLPEAWRE
jgi:DNA-binding MarR family transcriptional regulator